MNPDISIVIPVYNEATLLEPSLNELSAALARRPASFEIIVAENGSSDGTRALAAELARRSPHVRVVSSPEPNYGAALKLGILATRGQLVFCDEIDLCDLDFHERAFDLLGANAAELVVGSKVTRGASDHRPLLRRGGTLAYTTLLRALVGFHGTDTHGPKAFRRAALLPVVEACVVDRDVFASELVIRATRAALRVVEIPIRVAEKRPPSVHLLRRIPNVLAKVWKLRRALGAPS
jgi:glycosyltransferase involved in cell wall biosynthesis